MSIPEIQPVVPPDQQVQEIPNQPEISEAVEKAGVMSIPSVPQQIVGTNNQVVAQPVPAPSNQKTITIPAQSQEALNAMEKGDIQDSRTWFGVFWLMKIEKALKHGIGVLFGAK